MNFLLAFFLVLPVFVRAEPVQARSVAARHPVNDLAEFIRRNPSVAAEDVSKRVVRLVLGNEGGDYLFPGLRDDAVQAALLEEAARSLTQSLLKDRTGDGAVLFFVLGTERDAPGWIQSPDLAAALAQKKTQRLKIFLESMKHWRGKLGRGNAEQEVAAFLNEAVTRAFEVFSQPLIRKEFVAGFPDVSGPLLAPVSGLGGGGARLNDPTKGFSWESLYERGGVVMDITVGDVKRRMSMKIYTKPDEKGHPVDKIGIFDITYPNEPFGRRFDLSQGGEKTGVLDTRNSQSPKYTLKLTPTTDGDMAISFGNEGLKGDVMKTSLKELYEARARQAVDEGGKITLDGKDFIVLGQGGAKGALLFFSSDVEERLAKGENVKPELVSEVNERSSDGRNVNVSGSPALGRVGNKFYRLVFNDELKYWEVQEGEPDPLPSKPGEGGSSTPTVTGQDIGDADLEKDILKDGLYEINLDVANGLDPEWVAQVKVFDLKAVHGFSQRDINRRHLMMVPASVRKERKVFVSFPLPAAGYDGMERQDKEVRGIGRYLAVTSKISTVYQDLSEPATLPGPGEMDKVFEYDASCVVDEVKKTLCVADLVLLQDAMTRAGFSGREIADARGNAAQALKDSGKTKNDEYRVEGGKAVNSLTLRVGEAAAVAIWPQYKPSVRGHGHLTSAR
jgi:hypothetical protein